MFPTINLGPVVFSTYTVLIDIGIIATLIWLWVRAPAHGREPVRWLDGGLWATAGGVLGGRVAFAIANWAYFQNHFGEIFRLWEGGYAWPGAAVGGLLGLFIYSQIRREPIAPILDELALPTLLISMLGWVGCMAASCAAGQAVPPGTLSFAVNWPDLYGVILPRWPTQIIGLGLSLIASGYLLSQRDRKWPNGFRFALAITLIGLITFMVSTVRGDEVPLVNGWRVDSVADVVMTVLGAVVLVALWAFEPGGSNKKLTAESAEKATES